MKKIFTTLAIGASCFVFGQTNCNLINSATFTVPDDSVITLQGQVPYVSDGTTQPYMPMDIGQWQYIAITKDNSNQAKVYKNGQLVYQGSYTNVSYSWMRIDLGAVYYIGYSGWFNGWIDEVRISNTVRSASSIASYYASNSAFTSDGNTTGLWHFDQTSGTTVNAATGGSGTISNATWSTQGKFSDCLYYNGTNAYTTISQSVPTSNMTCEFWIKPNIIQGSWPVSWYGSNTAGFATYKDTAITNYTWSTGSNGNSISVNPSAQPYIWVTDGNCTDTIFFNSQSATVYDTVTTHTTVYDTTHTTVYDSVLVSVTDTLIINASLTGVNSPNNINTLKVYPNPSHDHITIDYGNYLSMNGYTLKITNSLSQIVFISAINQQQSTINLNTWTGNGVYFIHIIDSLNNTIDIKKIIVQ